MAIAGLARLGCLDVSAVPVGLELSLLVDVSASVDASEYDLQLQGYVGAFNDPLIHAAISANPTGSIAVNMVMWSSASARAEVLGWTRIGSADDARAVAGAIGGIARPSSGLTAPQTALSRVITGYGDPFDNAFDGMRHVIDISLDGVSNDDAGQPASTAGLLTGCLDGGMLDDCASFGRDAALEAGVDAINVLAIDPAPSSPSFALVQEYATGRLLGGDGRLFTADGFGAFGDAIFTKLEREISVDVPAPGTGVLAGLGWLACMGLRRRKGATHRRDPGRAGRAQGRGRCSGSSLSSGAGTGIARARRRRR